MCTVEDVNHRKATGFKTVINKGYLNYDPQYQTPGLRMYNAALANETVKMTVAPNPATSEVGITVNLPESALKNKHSVVITDAVGKVVYTADLASETVATLNVDLARFTSGIYFVKLLGGNETQTEKLVITK